MPFSSKGTRLFERAQWVADFSPNTTARSSGFLAKRFKQETVQPPIHIYVPGAISQVPYSYDPKLFQPKNAIR